MQNISSFSSQGFIIDLGARDVNVYAGNKFGQQTVEYFVLFCYIECEPFDRESQEGKIGKGADRKMHDSHPEVVVFWSDKSNEIEMRKEEKEFGDLLENGDARRLWNWYEEAKDNITVVTVLFASALCFAVEFILSARNVQGDFIEWTTGDKLERWAGILLGVVLIFVLSGIVAGIFVNFVALNKKTFAICAMVVVASILIVCDILGHGADRQVDEKVKEAYAAGYSEGCEEGSNSGGIG